MRILYEEYIKTCYIWRTFEEFVQPYHITAYRLSKIVVLSQTQIGRIIKGKRGITVDTALRFAQAFNTGTEF